MLEVKQDLRNKMDWLLWTPLCLANYLKTAGAWEINALLYSCLDFDWSDADMRLIYRYWG